MFWKSPKPRSSRGLKRTLRDQADSTICRKLAKHDISGQVDRYPSGDKDAHGCQVPALGDLPLLAGLAKPFSGWLFSFFLGCLQPIRCSFRCGATCADTHQRRVKNIGLSPVDTGGDVKNPNRSIFCPGLIIKAAHIDVGSQQSHAFPLGSSRLSPLFRTETAIVQCVHGSPQFRRPADAQTVPIPANSVAILGPCASE